MKIITLLCAASIMMSHSIKAMEQWPHYFKNISCPGPDEQIDKEALREANPFWKNIANTASQEEKDTYLAEALDLPGEDPLLWMQDRKAIACALATGANPNIQNYGTAFHSVLIHNDNSLIEFALQCRADPNINFHDQPSLFLAQSLNVAKLLIEHKADILTRSFTNKTVLHKVAYEQSHSAELILYYIQQGCDVNAQDEEGNTPIMSAGVISNKIKFRLLLEAGADVTIVNKHGETLWDRLDKVDRFEWGKKDRLKQAQEIYNQFQQECTVYGLLTSAVRLFTNKP